ncbi:MAG: tetratricopeptide repeat protein, partial [Candidatus Rokubacteria bacterium]|nr:tetratricopeptide repeat protein [Candidatus Rokubacteria bacterium]
MSTYVRLGDLYAGSGKYDQALPRLDQALKVNPRNQVALMLSGVVHQRQGDVPGAVAAYEKVPTLNPRSVLAGNNLAWLLAEHGGDKERALQLAQMAKELAPEDASVSDTLGWILYQRGIYHRALA